MVPVLDKENKALMPCSEKRARRLMESQQALACWQKGIFCIKLTKEPSNRKYQEVVLGIDPGSKRESYTVTTEKSMRRFAASAIISSLFLLGCPEKVVVPNNVVDAQVIDVVERKIEEVIARDNWEITFPISWKEKQITGNNANLLATNDLNKSLLIIKISEYKGSYDQLAINLIRDYRSQSAKVISAKSIQSNDHPFIEVQAEYEGITSTTWMTVINGFSYVVDCGGPTTNSSLIEEECKQIFLSFKIK